MGDNKFKGFVGYLFGKPIISEDSVRVKWGDKSIWIPRSELPDFVMQLQEDNRELLKTIRAKQKNSPATDIYGDNYDWENDPCGLKHLEGCIPEQDVNLWDKIPSTVKMNIQLCSDVRRAVVDCAARDVPLVAETLRESLKAPLDIIWNIGGKNYE